LATLDRLTSALNDRYRIERELGQGGMATVYLAEDLKHGRKVAIKVLHPELSAVIGGDRFLAEIKVTANLQHPHILGLIDSGEADGLLYYVMPFVAGESLRALLNREKQLPVDDAIRLSKEVASALDYAHRHGVVHRDIKPENILLQEGSALVADFGIALAVQQAGGSRMTQTGMSLGTPAYMSPEQAMGEREIGARSDVYALGAMTYEMLAGEPPFMGPNSQAIVAKVLTESPRPMRPARPSISPAVEHAVLTALQKLPADRYGSAKDFADALDGKGGTYAATTRLPAHPPTRLTRVTRPVTLATLALISIAAGMAGWFLRGRPRAAAPPAHFAITIPPDQRITPWADPGAALSSDGQVLLYNADGGGVPRIYARRLTDAVGAALPGSDGALGPVFSPDDKWVLFIGPGNVWMKLPAQGGAAVDIPVPPGVTVGLMRWNGDDGFAVTLNTGDLAVLHASGTISTIAKPDRTIHEQSLDVMEVLPDGNFLAIGTDVYPAGHAMIIDRASGKRTPLLDVPVSWVAAANGYLVWTDPVGVLFAAPFDGKRVTGSPHGFGATAQTTRGTRPRVAIARKAGALVYVPAQQASLARVTRDGRILTLLDSPRAYHNPHISPDGKQVLLDIASTERDVWLLDLADTTLNRITFETTGHDAVWTPDGKRIVFGVSHGGQIGVYARAADGGGSIDSIDTEGPQLSVHAVTPDGLTGIAVRVTSVAANGFDLMSVPLTGADRHATPLLDSRYMEGFPALSTDGRWLAYVGDESGRQEVYVRSFPALGGKVVVSQNGGSEPVWSRDGRELYYIGLVNGAPHLMVAQVETTPQFRVVSRTALFDYSDFETATPHANFDVMPDGKSFLMVHLARASEFTYLQDWPALINASSSPPRSP
jgi:eukaryotic-like serine/threonine-protein kinase